MQTRILLVFTGGTIGSLSDNGNIDLDPNARFKLLELFTHRYANAGNIEFKILQPLNILSENLHPKDWEILIHAIDAEDPETYDGIIVSHGTDTLAFSAATLDLYYHSLGKPILLVSSHLPLENPLANGIPNLIAAVDFIVQQAGNGVFVAYQNPGDTLKIHQGSRLLSCLPLSGDFMSIQSRPLMTYESGQFTAHYHPLQPTTAHHLVADFNHRILLIRPYPGIDYRAFNPEQFDVVLHDLYHSGTACSREAYGAHHDLGQFILRCRERSVPVYLCPAQYSESAYSSTRALLANGGKMIWNMSLESCFAKLHLALSSFSQPSEINAFLDQNICGEKIDSASHQVLAQPK